MFADSLGYNALTQALLVVSAHDALVVGADAGIQDLLGGTLLRGLMVGYLHSTVGFEVTPSSAGFSGFLVGDCGTYPWMSFDQAFCSRPISGPIRRCRQLCIGIECSDFNHLDHF